MINATAKIVSPVMSIDFHPNNLSSSQLPPFFIVDVKWGDSMSTLVVSLIASSVSANPLAFVGGAINLSITALCMPGQFVNMKHLNASSNQSLLIEFLSSSNRSSLCASCPSGTVSVQEDTYCIRCPSGTHAASDNALCVTCSNNTWASSGTQGACFQCPAEYAASHARDRCITLTFSIPPPAFFTSSTPFQLPSVIATDNFNQSMLMNGSVTVSLTCSLAKCSALRKGGIFQRTEAIKNGVASVTLNVIADDSDTIIGIGYEWTLESSNGNGVAPPNSVPLGIYVVYPAVAMMLGPLPSVVSVIPSFVSFVGGTTVTVTSSVWAILSRMQGIAANRTATCKFVLLSSSRVAAVDETFSVEALQTIGSAIDIRTCIAPQAPPFRIWNMSITLADGRSSSNAVQIEAVCPNNCLLYTSPSPRD